MNTAQPSEPINRVNEVPKPEPAAHPKPSTVIDHERLIAAHNGYAGNREDGQLVDADWPDIKSRLFKGDTKVAIAGDYDADVADLEFFIQSAQQREARSPPGEARAPLGGITSGAS